MVFRRGPHHRRPPDIDVLNRLIPGDIRLGNRFSERIEIDHHHVDRGDLLLLKIRLMGWLIPLGQNSPMDAGMQGFDASAEDFRCTGVLGHARHRKTGLLQHLGGSTTGEQLIAVRAMQSLREGYESRLIGNTQQSDRSHRSDMTWS